MTEKREENLNKALRLFICTERLHHSVFDRRASQFGLHRSQHRMIMRLCKAGKAMTQKELANIMEISPAAVAVTLKRLEDDGYITRKESLKDSRANEIQVTEKAKQLAVESEKVFKSIDNTMFEALDDKELEHFTACLEKMQKSLREMEVKL